MSFQCPVGYGEIEMDSLGALSVEDVQDDDTELYLIKAPSNVKFSSSEIETLNLDHSNSDPGCFKDCYSYFVEQAASSDLKSCLVLLPSNSSESLNLVKKHIERQIVISKNLDTPMVTIPSPTKKFAVFPDGLRQRFKPFGSEEPNLIRKKHKKKKAGKRKRENNDHSDEKFEMTEVQHISKKKKAEKHKRENNDHGDEKLEMTEIQHISKKKKKKKKH